MGTGEKSLLCNPGSELRLLGGGREKKEGEGNKRGGGGKGSLQVTIKTNLLAELKHQAPVAREHCYMYTRT